MFILLFGVYLDFKTRAGKIVGAEKIPAVKKALFRIKLRLLIFFILSSLIKVICKMNLVELCFILKT
jgi:hypothetical protein